MSDKPQVWIFCGPNGAGKLTLAERFAKARLPIVNPDVIAQNLPRRADGSLAELEAGRKALLVAESDQIRHHAAFPEWVRRWLPTKYQNKEQGT